MTVKIEWNDEHETTYDNAVSVEQTVPRDAFRLYDESATLVALIPDYGVRSITIEQ